MFKNDKNHDYIGILKHFVKIRVNKNFYFKITVPCSISINERNGILII